MNKKRLIIIGGGFAGVTLAKQISERFETILIDSKSYFEFTPGIPEVLVNAKRKSRLQFQYEEIKNIKFVKGEVVNFDNNKVTLRDGKNFDFDFLVLSTGSSYSSPIKELEETIQFRLKDLEKYSKKIINSKRILIVGGGIVGVEIAGEIIYKFKDKSVSIIQGDKSLVPRNNKKTQEYIRKTLEENGIKIYLNERFEEKKGNKIQTDKRVIDSDLVIFCLGIFPNTNFINKKYLDEKNYVNVDRNFRVIGKKNIFAIGDITNIKEEKTAQSAILHAKILSENLKNILIKKPLKQYKTQKRPFVILLGKKAILEIGSTSITGIIPKILKRIVEKKFMFSFSN